MKKLLAYTFLMVVPFGDGEYKTVYKLTILKTYFFGLIKKEITINYEISMFESIAEHKKHWHNLIKTSKRL